MFYVCTGTSLRLSELIDIFQRCSLISNSLSINQEKVELVQRKDECDDGQSN